MRFKKAFVLLVFIIYGASVTSAKEGLTRRLAQKIIDYLDVEHYFYAEENIDKLEDAYSSKTNSLKYSIQSDDDTLCDELTEIQDYFFRVYSSSFNKSLSWDDLENLLEYQFKKSPKDKEIATRTKRNKCTRNSCFHSNDIFDLVSRHLSSNISLIDSSSFLKICPIILYNNELKTCVFNDGVGRLSGVQKWVLGLVFAGIVTLWSWNGAVVLPLIHKKFYKRILTFMISLAFGCLCGNSLLKFIPLADGFEHPNLDEVNHSYFYKHLLIMVILFFFFLFERCMKIFAIYRTIKFNRKQKRLDSITNTLNTEISDVSLDRKELQNEFFKDNRVSFSLFNEGDENHDGANAKRASTDSKPRRKSLFRAFSKEERKRRALKKRMSIDVSDINILGVQNINEITDKLAARLEIVKEEQEAEEEAEARAEALAEQSYNKTIDEIFNIEGFSNNNKKPKRPKKKSNRLCCTSLTKDIDKVKPIGWMAIFGDGLGNFMDGLSIGASINQGLVIGLTTALACWLGNIPQELGDFALLVRAGMTPFQALFYNYLSSNTAYIGCIIGIIFGNNAIAARWIFSISGASTLFLSLAVLLPEMNEEFEDEKEPFREKIKITYIQILGLLAGYSIMIILNMYEDDIEF